MNGLLNWMERAIVPVAAKIGAQKHLVAIRDAFAGIMPLILAGAIAVGFNNIFLSKGSLLAEYTYKNGLLTGFFDLMEKTLVPINGNVWSGTLAILSLAFLIGLAYHRARQENMDAPSNILIVLGSMICMGYAQYFNVLGLMLSMVLGLVFSEIHFFCVRKNWTIKMPDSVPPAVSKSFAAVIPGLISLTLASVVALLISTFFEVNGAPATIFTWFEANIQSVLNQLGASPVTILIMTALTSILWFFGLHGHQMLTPLYDGIYKPFQISNQEAFVNGARTIEDGLIPWVRGSWDAYAQVGGSGSTLCLLIAIFLVGKVVNEREVAKLSAPLGAFQINEPVTFGIPIVLNVIYVVPFIIVPVIQVAIALFATYIGFARPIVNEVVWTAPPVLNAFIGTNGHLGATLVALINVAVGIVIYLPFVLVSNKLNNKEAK